MAKKKATTKKRKSKKRVSHASGIPSRKTKNGKDRFIHPAVREDDGRLNSQWWNLRSKHGRDKIFETPEIMWEAACEYFQWCVDNPLKEQKAWHSDGFIAKTDLNKTRAFTMKGLCLWLGVNEAYFRNFELQGRGQDADFSAVISKIKDTIYKQKFEAAAADLLNANIISRDLGLKENIDATTGGDKLGSASMPKINIYNNAPPLSSDEKEVDLKKEGKE